MINIQPHQIFAFDMADFMMRGESFSEIREIFRNGIKEFTAYEHLESGQEAITLIKRQIAEMQSERLDVIYVRDNSKYGTEKHKKAVIREEQIFDKERALLFVAKCYKHEIHKRVLGSAYMMCICEQITEGDIEDMANNI
jgi:hypothetical protein